MATLKSPRNTRNKTRWAVSSAKRINSNAVTLKGTASPKSKHKLQMFLRNSAHWVVTESVLVNHTSLWLPDYIKDEKPPVYIKYGKNTLDYSKTHPFVYSKQSRDKVVLPGFVFWANSANS